MTPFLILTRAAIIGWTTLAVFPLEVAFNVVEGELQRRDVELWRDVPYPIVKPKRGAPWERLLHSVKRVMPLVLYLDPVLRSAAAVGSIAALWDQSHDVVSSWGLAFFNRRPHLDFRYTSLATIAARQLLTFGKS
jgi:hypothetical protein